MGGGRSLGGFGRPALTLRNFLGLISGPGRRIDLSVDVRHVETTTETTADGGPIGHATVSGTLEVS